MRKKIALITGITGQDGAYLSNLLLNNGYKVYGGYRRSSSINLWRLEELGIVDSVDLVPFELLEKSNIERIIKKIKPDEIYNFATQSFVSLSFENPIYTAKTNAIGTLRILESIRMINKKIKFYQASSSEMFGDNPNYPFNEDSKFMPASPYACSKVFAHNLVRNYRESYNLHASSGILFNHESPMRGENFVTRKITLAAANIKLGLQDKLFLGNLDAKRDWGFAGDYVEVMWKMLQQPNADDYVIATGETHSVKEFLDSVFSYADLDPSKYVEIDKNLFRPQEVPYLIGDSTKAQKVLNWEPKITFEKLTEMMFLEDYKRIKNSL